MKQKKRIRTMKEIVECCCMCRSWALNGTREFDQGFVAGNSFCGRYDAWSGGGSAPSIFWMGGGFSVDRAPTLDEVSKR